jgi:hypothetical protein
MHRRLAILLSTTALTTLAARPAGAQDHWNGSALDYKFQKIEREYQHEMFLLNHQSKGSTSSQGQGSGSGYGSLDSSSSKPGRARTDDAIASDCYVRLSERRDEFSGIDECRRVAFRESRSDVKPIADDGQSLLRDLCDKANDEVSCLGAAMLLKEKLDADPIHWQRLEWVKDIIKCCDMAEKACRASGVHSKAICGLAVELSDGGRCEYDAGFVAALGAVGGTRRPQPQSAPAAPAPAHVQRRSGT